VDAWCAGSDAAPAEASEASEASDATDAGAPVGAASSSGLAGQVPVEKATLSTSGAGPVFDPAVLLAVTGDDREFLQELAEEFARSAARAREELTAAVAARDLKAVAEVAHRFKSAAGQVGARGAQELSAALERLGRAGAAEGAAASRTTALEAAQGLVDELLPVLDALEQALLGFAAASASGGTAAGPQSER
jgi:HPt (histidine-containing phosphotransfer) domain-containing protein